MPRIMDPWSCLRLFVLALLVLGIASGCGRHFDTGSKGRGDCFVSADATAVREECVDDIGGWAVVEGDIVVGRVDEIRARGGARLGVAVARGSAGRWPGGVIPYVIDPSVHDSRYLGPERIDQAIAHYEENRAVTRVRLVPRTNEPDYVVFTRATQGECRATIGRAGGRQYIWLTDSCERGSIIHEIGHALGLPHEHNREDRDDHVEVLWDKVGDPSNFQRAIAGAQDIGPYDYFSIMHYGGGYFRRKDGLPTTGIGQRNGLSDGDKTTLRTLYGPNFVDAPSWDGEASWSSNLPPPPIQVLARGIVQLNLIDNSDSETETLAWMATAPTGPWTVVARRPGTAQGGAWSPRVYDLNPATRYYFRATAIRGSAGSDSTRVHSIVPTIPSRPAAPTGLTGTAIAEDMIEVRWRDNSNNEDRFLVERLGPTSVAWTVLDPLPANATSVVVTRLSPSTEYQFRVRAQNSAGLSDYSEILRVRTGDQPPAPVTNLRVLSTTTNSVTIAWDASVRRTDRYGVYRSTRAEERGTLLQQVSSSQLSYVDGGVAPGSTYYYSVTAINGAGESGAISVQANTLPAPTAVSITAVVTGAVAAGSQVTYRLANAPHAVGEWVGLALRGTPDTSYVDQRLTNRADSGVVVVHLSAVPGTYELRLYRDAGTTVLARSAPFNVTAGGGDTPRIMRTTSTLAPGAQVGYAISGAPAAISQWVSIAQVGSPDTSYLTYAYTNGMTAGFLTLPGTTASNQYEFRLYRDGGFTVIARSDAFYIATSNQTGGSPSIRADSSASQFTPSGRVAFTIADAPNAPGQWIGLGQTTDPSSVAIGRHATNGASSGVFNIPADITPGAYELRLYRDSGSVLLARSAPFAIAAPPAASIALVAGSSTLSASGRASFSLTNAPNQQGQWVGLSAVGSASSSYVAWVYSQGSTTGSVTIPSNIATGSYELRLYRDGGYTIVARSAAFTITTSGSSGTPTVTYVAASSNPVSNGRVAFTLSQAPNQAGQWVGLSRAGSATTSYVSWVGTTASSGTIAIPAGTAAGYYELRLYRDGGYTLLASSATFTIR